MSAWEAYLLAIHLVDGAWSDKEWHYAGARGVAVGFQNGAFSISMFSGKVEGLNREEATSLAAKIFASIQT